MTPRHLLLLVLVLLLGASAAIGIRVSGATYVDESRTETRVLAANDWTPPLVTVTSPGPEVSERATVTATASDSRGSVVAVDLEHRLLGAPGWTTLCSDTAAPWSCEWDTTALADARYELRAVATDDSGNAGVSATVTTEVANDRGWVSLRSPGEAVSGNVTMRASSSLWFATVSYVFEYAPTGTSSWTTACRTSSYGLLPGICTWDASGVEGRYDLRVRASATDNGSALSVVRDVLVDNVAPTAALTVPAGSLSGTVQMAATAEDAHSGLASVAVQTRAAGGSWTSCGVRTVAPFGCSFDTTGLVDGTYEFRAVATDRAGNQTITATTSRSVANVAGTVSITSPTAGATVRGRSVSVSAAATAVRGVDSVRFEVKPTGSSSWIMLCTTKVAPYTCTADSTTAPQGRFEIRAVLTDRAGAFFTSAVVTVSVDNTPPRALDVQASNGGTRGVADRGDKVVLTFTEEIALGSIKPGWTGSSTSLTPTFYGKNARNSPNSQRNVLQLGNSLGVITFAQNYVKDRAVVAFGATMVASSGNVNGVPSTVITITLGAPDDSRNLGPVTTTTGSMIWSPGAGMLSPDGLAVSTDAVTESGPSNDADF